MNEEFDPTEPSQGLPGVAAVFTLIAVALPWIVTTAGSVDPGYRTLHGLLAAVVALVVLVAVVADPDDRRTDVSLVGGAVVVLLALARYVTLGGGFDAGLGLYVTFIAGLAMVAGGILGR
jgi:uncharacterized membrane protein